MHPTIAILPDHTGPVSTDSRLPHPRFPATPGIVTRIWRGEFGPVIEIDGRFSDYAGAFQAAAAATSGHATF